jgi:carbon-monoxide dehydrogenase large subunit
MVVEGQLHGGIVQGIGAARAEELIYDGAGQLLTGSLMEYGVPRADQVPSLEVVALDFPSTRNEMGIKGVGESGIISPVPAIEDALADHGAEVSRVPLTAASVWEALQRASTHRGHSRV